MEGGGASRLWVKSQEETGACADGEAIEAGCVWAEVGVELFPVSPCVLHPYQPFSALVVSSIGFSIVHAKSILLVFHLFTFKPLSSWTIRKSFLVSTLPPFLL